MMKFRNFSESVQNTFEGQEQLMDFCQLMTDTANHSVEGFSEKEANEKIREKMFDILGLDFDEKPNRREIRRAIRRHKVDIFEVTEDTLENLLVSGWDANPFFREFVESKNYNDGDTNEFYVEDDCVITMGKVSGNHHDLKCRVRIA